MLCGAQAQRAGSFTENQSTVHLYGIRYRSAPPQTAIAIRSIRNVTEFGDAHQHMKVIAQNEVS